MKSICKTINGDKFWVIPNTEKDKLSCDGLGILHREDGPAFEGRNGTKEWWINGKLHREDGPAMELVSSSKIWFINGKKHRENGPAVEWCDNDIAWCLNDKCIIPTNEMMKKYIKLNPDNILKIYSYPLLIQLLAISLKPTVIFNIKYPDPKLKELYPKLYVLKDSGLI